MEKSLKTMRLYPVLFALLAALGASTISCNRSSSGGGEVVTPPKGPDRFRVKMETTKGDFVIETVRAWSPLGADRFHELVTAGFYDEARFFRVVPGFVVQFGIKGVPEVDKKWKDANIDDDPVVGMSNTPATVTFAKAGMPRTRSTQLFINIGENARLDAQGFTPFGRVTEGMNVVFQINTEYAEKPDQGKLTEEGNEYLKVMFPNLDYVKKATIIP